MRLESGIPVPHFETVDIEGNPVTPEGYRGRRWWLILARFAACPFCSLRLQRLMERYGAIDKAEVDVLVIFPSKEKRVRQYVKKYSPPFRVVSDDQQAIFKQFGSETSWSGELKTAVNIPKVLKALAKTKMNPLAIDDAPHRMPCEYLIDPDGNIAQVHYGETLDDGFPVETVLEWAGAAEQ